MKKIFWAILAVAAITSCHRDPVSTEQGFGRLSVGITPSGDYQTKAGNADVNEFVIDITRPSDGYVKHFDRFGDMPQILELGSGEYTITASSPETKNAAWDLPIYGASTDFSIRVGELTPITMVATLQNMKVSFSLSENFKKELSNYTITVTNASSWDKAVEGENALVWADKAAVDEGKPGYFSVAPLLVKVDGYRNIDGSETHSGLTITSVAPRDHHIIYLDAKVTGSVNGVSLTIDDSVNEKDSDVNVDGWEEVPVDGGGSGSGDDDPDDPSQPDNPPVVSTAPTMTWESNPDFAPVPIENQMNVEILIEAPETVQEFLVTVDSAVLSETIAQMGGHSDYHYSADNPFVMDLINDQALVSALNGMIPVGDQLKDQTQINFSLSQLVPLILVYSPESGSNHIFTLKVTDAKGQSLQKSVTFVAL
ncbi:MAG: DUF4493 domain-containing protein [Bacteroidales bacterium]|nr:DUF4493 domain-containing protein [Bacteroidales bacterium]